MPLLSRVAAPLRDMFSKSRLSFFGHSSLGLKAEDAAPNVPSPKQSPKPSFGLPGWNKKGREQAPAPAAKTKRIQVVPASTSPREVESKEGSRNAVMRWGKLKSSLSGFKADKPETASDKFAKLVFQTMEIDLVNNPPPKVLKIGGFSIHKNVGIADLKENAARFAKLDKLGKGRVRLDRVMAIAGGNAGPKQVFGNNKLAERMKNRKASLTTTQDDGTIDLQDFLRLHYPEARDQDIDIMVKVVRELRGEKMYSRQYPKQHQQAAAQHWERVSKGKGSADIDALEDFLLDFVPDGDHYSMLKQLSTSLDDLYEEAAEVQKEEFMYWFLTHLME